MYFLLNVVLPLLLLSIRECESATSDTISVSNGQNWAAWGSWVSCPSGTYATGFSLKVEPDLGFWYDDTALNAIALYCTKATAIGGSGGFTRITSTEGSWGSWTQTLWCPSGVLKSFQLQVQSYQGLTADDTAANNIRFKCSGNQVLEGSGTNRGYWDSWSSDCWGTGICGIRTKVQPPQGIWDDSALNDVQFRCCS